MSLGCDREHFGYVRRLHISEMSLCSCVDENLKVARCLLRSAVIQQLWRSLWFRR